MTLTTEQLRARIGHLKERLRDMKQHKYPDNCPNATAYLESLKAERQQDIALLEELLANREAQPVLCVDRDSDFIKHIQKCSEEVAKWPEWERRGADVTEFTDSPAPGVPDDSPRQDAEHVASVLEAIGSFEADDIDGDTVDLRFELDGVDTGSEASITEYAARGADVINQLLRMPVDQPVSSGCTLPSHVYRELVNSLRDTAVKYQGTQQLREQLSRTLTENGLVAAAPGAK